MRYRYASFNRPLWCGFDPGCKFEIVEIKESDYHINGRKPHVVFETFESINLDKIDSLELTDISMLNTKKDLLKYFKSTPEYPKIKNGLSTWIWGKILNGELITRNDIDDIINKIFHT